MLTQIIGEIVTTVLGEAVIGALFPNWSKPQPPPKEGVWNASLGSVGAFVAAVAAVFVGISIIGMRSARQPIVASPCDCCLGCRRGGRPFPSNLRSYQASSRVGVCRPVAF